MQLVYEKCIQPNGLILTGWFFCTDDGEQGPYNTEKEALQAFQNYFKSCPTCED